MKKLKKFLALGLSAAMVMGMTACGNAEGKQSASNGSQVSNATDISSEVVEVKKPVTLEWWYRGNGIQKDTELVENEFNKLLQTYPGMEHVTVKLNCYTGADYANAVALAQSAGQQIDILNSVYLNFADQVTMGTYISLNDMLAENEALYNELPEWLWDLGSVDGEIYMVPHYQRGANQEYLVIPKDYWDKYANQDAITELCANTDRTMEEVASVLEEYVLAVQAGEGATKYGVPFGQMYSHEHGFLERFDDISNSILLFEDNEAVEYMYASERVKKAYEISAQWYDKGIIHPEVMTVNNMGGKNMLNPVSYCFSLQNGAGSGEMVSKQLTSSFGFDVVAIPIWDDYFIKNTWGAGGDGITATCKNPEEALRLIELMTTEEGIELYNMVVYGLEGTHYEKLDDTHIKTFEYDGTQGGTDTSYSAMKWIMGNTFHAYLNQGCSDSENEIARQINESSDNKTSSIMGFIVDISSIETEIEQIKAVKGEFYGALSGGALGTAGWEEYYNKFVQKLESAGLQEVLDEIQNQVDEFKAAK
ncbi:MAG: ABC transporter substrate-binding protein [Lachnospiraceae bacterium]|nr:ABC transporter substrate-binding protein [Lachnospiraceae bacterium]